MLKQTLKSTAAFAQSFSRDENGSVAVMFGGVLLTLMLAVGVAYDGSMLYKTKQELQHMVDAAALTNAKAQHSSQALLDTTAQDHLDTNKTMGDIELASATRIGASYTVSATVPYQTSFMQLIGFDTIDVAAAGTTVYEVREFNIALVLDTTGSMGQTATGALSGSKMDNLKVAANGLIDSLDSVPGESVRVSVVPFAQYVNVGTANRNASYMDVPSGAWNGCVGSRTASWNLRAQHGGEDFPGITGVSCGAAVLPLTDNLASARARINSMNPSGLTYIPAGLSWGWRTLTESTPFTQSSTASPSAEKILIVMTDGKNTRAQSSERHDGTNIDAANNATDTLCTVVKNDGITVYTIGYELNDFTTQTIMRNCATNTDNYFQAEDSDDLRNAFAKISASIQTLRLTN